MDRMEKEIKDQADLLEQLQKKQTAYKEVAFQRTAQDVSVEVGFSGTCVLGRF